MVSVIVKKENVEKPGEEFRSWEFYVSGKNPPPPQRYAERDLPRAPVQDNGLFMNLLRTILGCGCIFLMHTMH